jgi:hypothetical protein
LRAGYEKCAHAEADHEALRRPDWTEARNRFDIGGMRNREHKQAEWNKESAAADDFARVPGIQKPPNNIRKKEDEEGLR